ncbi:unnamed protein product [Schistosoma margrebowiei]|uniref:Uncharacterized protein n=1 Tax=Schistosoma margrebowiei TaxID=48269 RepID=A0A183L9W6_9TREM|nr:unnamed protein product [Schistosoma margrebowiei]
MRHIDICHTTPFQESHLEPTVLGQTISLRTTNLITTDLCIQLHLFYDTAQPSFTAVNDICRKTQHLSKSTVHGFIFEFRKSPLQIITPIMKRTHQVKSKDRAKWFEDTFDRLPIYREPNDLIWPAITGVVEHGVPTRDLVRMHDRAPSASLTTTSVISFHIEKPTSELFITQLMCLKYFSHGLAISIRSNSNQSLINNSSKANPNAPSFTESLGYGFLCVTLTNLCALVGIVFTLLKKYRFFPTILSFMVATAVGSLLSTSIIVLIPEALQILQPTGNKNTKDSDSYVIKSITVCIGVFFFYILEFLLRLIPQCFQKKKTHSNDKSQNGFHIDQFNHHHHHQLSYHQQGRPSLVIPVEPVADGDKDGPIVEFTPNRSNQSKTMNRSLVVGETDLQCESPPTEDVMNHLPSYENSDQFNVCQVLQILSSSSSSGTDNSLVPSLSVKLGDTGSRPPESIIYLKITGKPY